jgi:hypothetical protein
MTEPDDLQLKARALIESLRTYSVAAAEAARSAPDTDLESANEKIRRAQDLLRESMVEAACILLLDEVRAWPAWHKREDFAEWQNFDAQQVAASKEAGDNGTRKGEQSTVEFTFDDRRWRVVFVDEGYSRAPGADAAFGRFELSVDGERVLDTGLIRNPSREYDNWRFVGVEALRVGDWMKYILDISAHIEAGTHRRRQSYGRDEKLAAARNIEL